MKISKKRINNTNCVAEYSGKKIRLALLIDDGNLDLVKKAGFKNCEPGEKLLPAKRGPVSKANADGFWIKHKDLPKESYSYEVYWHKSQWTSGRLREMVYELVEVTRERYPRTFHKPYDVELYILEKDGKKYVVSESIEFTQDNEELIKVGINLFLELFHECNVVEDDLSDIELHTKIKRLSYVILPKGEYPFEKRIEQLDSVLKPLKKGPRKVIEGHFHQILKHTPSYLCMGINGFSGYVIFVFEKHRMCVFESTNPDNATYVFEDDWEKVSRMTKKEILDESLQKCRIIHRKDSWYKAIDELFA